MRVWGGGVIPWNKSDVSDTKFRAVWKFYDGATKRIAEHLHMHSSRVTARAAELGLKRADYLSPEQAAKILHVSANQVRRYCKRGLLPATRGLGAERPYWLITREAVEGFRAVVPNLALVPFTVEQGHRSVVEAARDLGLHDATVRHLCEDGTVAAYKSEYGYWQIPVAEVERVKAELAEHGKIAHRKSPVVCAPVQPEPSYPRDVPGLLRFFIERDGRSLNEIADGAEMNVSHLSRAVRGERDLSRKTIDAVAKALWLSDVDHGRLLVAAGLCPRQLIMLGAWDETIDTVAYVLGDERLSAAQRGAFRDAVLNIAAVYRGGAR